MTTILGQCELCGHRRRRVHMEEPNRFLDVWGEQGFVWVCAPCGRMNTAINTGKAIVCAAFDAATNDAGEGR